MNPENKKPAMSQKIFDMGLSVETVSVYLLCCGLADSETVISTKNLLGVWNSTEEVLIEGLANLEEKHILIKIISDHEDKNIYKMADVKDWELS